MAMKLIRKKAPWGGLLRWLTEDEETAVKRFFGEKNTHSERDRELAQNVILEMRQTEAWLRCRRFAGVEQCRPYAGKPDVVSEGI